MPSIGMELVGPYAVLAGRLEGVTWEKCVLQSRFFYDPPEMVTVAQRTSDQYHLGFFRCVCLHACVRVCVCVCDAPCDCTEMILEEMTMLS